jgi:cell shape-determining protein MreC
MFSSLSRQRVAVLLVLTSLLLLTIDRTGNPIIDRARDLMSNVLTPFTAAAEAVARPVQNAWNGITDYPELRQENVALRDQLETQRGAEIESRAAIREAQQLLELNRLTVSYQGEAARVVGAAPGNFLNTVEINKGTESGIRVGMPVVTGAGLVGKVSQVYPNRSVVLLITDLTFNIGAEVLTTGEPETPPASTVATTPSGLPVEGLGALTTTTTSTMLPPTDTTTSTTTTTLAGAVGVSGPPAPGSSSTSTTSTLPPVSRETGILSGQGPRQPLLLDFVDDSVVVGDVVQTAGGRLSIAPQGIPIGVISSVERNGETSSVVVQVTPAADLTNLNFVKVVLYAPTQGQS